MMMRYLIVLLLLACGACTSSSPSNKQQHMPLEPEAARYRSDAYTALAFKSLEQGKPEAASRQADSAVVASATSNALHARALGALALDDTASARTYFQKALDAQGGYSDAVLLLNYGTFLCNEGETPEGLAMLRRAAIAAPSEAARIEHLSATCAQPPEAAKRGLKQHGTPELNGFWDE